MPPASRTGFFSLIVLFLWRMPSVWIGGLGATVVALVLISEVGPRAAAAGALAVVTAAVGATISLDRRRGIGRRMLSRGGTVSARRVAALVISMGLIASVTTALSANLVISMRKSGADEVRNRSAPNTKRGIY